MARLIKTTIKPELSLVVRTIHNDNTSTEVELHIDDIVTDLRYVENQEIKTITGRVSKFNYSVAPVTRTYGEVAKIQSYFAQDVKIESIEVDRSTTNHSDVVVIPAREILENAGILDVKKMQLFMKYAVSIETLLSDNTVYSGTIKEGEAVQNVLCLGKTDDEVITGKVVAIHHDFALTPIALEMIVNGQTYELDLIRIKTIGKVSEVATTDTALVDTIKSNNGGVAFVGAGVFNTPLTLTAKTTISGAKAGISATKGRDVENFEGETVIGGKLTIPADAEVTFDGVVLTKDAYVSVASAKNVTVKNCIVSGLTPTNSNSFVILLDSNATTKLNISGCYFGNNAKTDTGKYKNTFELSGKVQDGSVIENNYFADGCSENNDVCIYNAEDGATITVRNNVWEKSANGVRVGTKGDVHCTVNIENNTYESTCEDTPEYAGLLLIQPYGAVTTSMEHVVINLNGTKHNDNLQVFYAYSGGNDMPFTDTNKPTLFVDGVETEIIPIGR